MRHSGPKADSKIAFEINDHVKVGDLVVVSQHIGVWYVESDDAYAPDFAFTMCRVALDWAMPAKGSWGYERVRHSRSAFNIQHLVLYEFRAARQRSEERRRRHR